MNQMTRQLVTVIVLLLVLTGLGFLVSKYDVSKLRTGTSTSQSTKDVKPVSYQGETGKTVLELLQRNHKVDTRDSSIGTLITGIDGVANVQTSATNGKAWIYYVDDQQGISAPNEAQTQDGQTVEWRYESY